MYPLLFIRIYSRAVALSIVCALSASAQSEAKHDRSSQAHPADPPQGFVRLWNLAENNDSVGIFLAEYGKEVPAVSERLWLARGSVAPHIRQYRPIPIGQYEVFVVRDSSNAKEGPKPISDDFEGSKDSVLLGRVGITVSTSGYYTIQLQAGQAGRWEAVALNDSKAEEGSVRVFNLTEGYAPSLALLFEQNEKPLIAEVKTRSETVGIPRAAPVTIKVSYTNPGNQRVRAKTVECDLRQFRSCSIVMTRDRYGRFSIFTVPDAPRTAAQPGAIY